MEKPLVSIIIPIYNVEKYIRNCLQSIVSQTYKNYEIILVDDGSKDQSIKIAKGYLDSFEKVDYRIIMQQNSGMGVARNKGVECSIGEWIFFMDSDDTIQLDAIELLVEATNLGTCDFVFGDFQRVSLGEEFKKATYKKSTSTYSGNELQELFLRRKKRVLVPGTLYKREWYETNNLYFENVRFSEDIHFLWRAISVAKQVHNVQIPLYNYLMRPNSIMSGSQIDKIIDGYMAIEKLYYEFQNQDNIIFSVKKWMLSRWVLGAMRASVSLMDWKIYLQFCRKIDAINKCKKLLDFPDYKVRFFAIIIMISLKLYYRIIKIVG